MAAITFQIPPFRKLIFRAIWVLLHIGLFCIGFFTQMLDPNLSNVNKTGFSVYFSRGAAICILFDAFFLLFPVWRTFLALAAPILTGYFGIPLDEPTSIHKLLAWTMLFFTAIHAVGFCFTFNTLKNRGVVARVVDLHFGTWGGATGWAMIFIMVIMYPLAHRYLRKRHYETFMNTHQLSMIFILLYILHPIGCFVKTNQGQCKTFHSNVIILPIYVLYLAERVYRFYKTRHQARIVDAIAHPGGVIELRIWAPWFKFTAGQHAKIQIPLIARDWHPFTPTSAPHEEYVSFHIHRAGDWTNAMARVCGYGRTDTNSPLDLDPATDIEKLSRLPITVRIDGPFGSLTEGMFRRNVAVLVGGGIGATPFASVLKDLIWRHQNHTTGTLRRVDFYWICRTTESLEWFRDEIARLEESSFNGFLRIFTHVTAKQTVLLSERLKTRTLMLAAPPTVDNTILEKNPMVRTRRGRPDFKKSFADIVSEFGTPEGAPRRENCRVGVYICGPAALRESIKNDAREAGKNGVSFGVFW